MKRLALILLASAAMPFAVPVHAQAQDQAEDAEAAPAAPDAAQETRAEPALDDLHTIYVSATGVDRLDVIAGTSVVSGIELQREASGQVGEVLDSLPGVTASGFAPGASRPILRGFGGDRVRVLTDGIGSLDASGASDDHAVAADPLIAERIEVLRGPAVLLYGSQAIGGAVNVITKRIPPRVPEEAIHIDALAGFDTVSNLREGGVSLDLPLGSSFAFHFDGSYRNTDDVEIPGFAASPGLRADLLARAEALAAGGDAAAADELRAAADIRDVLPNSWSETLSLGTGLAFFSGQSNLGASFDYYDTSYGIPGLPGGGEDEPVSIGLQKYRVDLRGALDLGSGFFDRVETRWAWSDYTHTEFEGDEVGTVFDVQGIEGRVELAQSPRDLAGGTLRGSAGAQFSSVDFAAIGDEAYIPPNITQSIALFTLQELDLDKVELEAGGRFESISIDAETLGLQRSFDTFSAALGGGYMLFEDFRLGVNLSRTGRAPSAQELFADGPHLATQQFELGDASLGIESSWGVEGYVRGEVGEVKINASLYRNWFSDFIYLAATGLEEDSLSVFAFRQQNADQWGFEGQVTFPLIEGDDFSLLGDLRGDFTRANLADGDAVPRIPPLSLYGALEGRWEHFDLRGEVEWHDSQSRLAPLETPTDSYAHVNLSLAWHPFEGAENFTLVAQVDNLFDAEGRRAASFTKDFVPLPGRNFSLSARASF